jgi:Uma2 family endonuclease
MSIVNEIAPLTLEEFLALPETDITYELKDGQAIPKMSPKFFHSSITGAIYLILRQWCQKRGRVGIEWAVILTRNGKTWVPVPDLTYVSFERLPADWMKDEACPVAPELVIEIISPGQSFGDLVEKAADYLNAGVLKVWIVDTQARSITIFYPEKPPQTLRGTSLLTNSLLEGLQLTPQQIFQQAGLSE